jgi:hypothetical protein
MIKLPDNTGQPNEDNKMSSLKEKIIKFFHTKIMGLDSEIYEGIRSLGTGQDDEQLSDDDFIVITSDEETNETNASEARDTCVNRGD